MNKALGEIDEMMETMNDDMYLEFDKVFSSIVGAKIDVERALLTVCAKRIRMIALP